MESTLRAGAGAPGLRLIETMLWDGTRFPRGALHLERLLRSGRRLGWSVPGEDLFARFPGAFPDGPARVRLTLDAFGAVDWQVGPLPPAKAEWRLGLAPARLSSADPWLTVKTTRRAVYEEARAALPPHLDEVVFSNERGEVCDGTITTLFFDRGEGMRTPPLACGLLPGVLRAEMGCVEEVLRVDDLARVRLWVGNALRGLCPAVWLGAA